MTAPAVRRAAARLAHLYRTNGARGVLAKLVERFRPRARQYRQRKARDDHAFDANGYDTGGIQHVFNMDLVDLNQAAAGCNHVAVPQKEFEGAIAAIDIDYRDFCFIDLGSGKGRAILMAADIPFTRIIGVEFARDLYQISKRNLAVRAERHGVDPRLELLCIDAAQFAYPIEPTILFLYNPFDPPVLTSVVERALMSWYDSPRPFRVIYLNPVHGKAWIAGGWHQVHASPGLAIYAPPQNK